MRDCGCVCKEEFEELVDSFTWSSKEVMLRSKHMLKLHSSDDTFMSDLLQRRSVDWRINPRVALEASSAHDHHRWCVKSTSVNCLFDFYVLTEYATRSERAIENCWATTSLSLTVNLTLIKKDRLFANQWACVGNFPTHANVAYDSAVLIRKLLLELCVRRGGDGWRRD